MSNLIYIADDDEIYRWLVQSLLEQEGYRVECFETGDQLLVAYNRQPCDLAILDIIMPGNSGHSVCKMLREVTDMPIIMLTGQNTDDDYVTGISQGCDIYLGKPFKPAHLIVHVKMLLLRNSEASKKPKADELQSFQYADIVLFPNKLTAYCNDQELSLTNNEFKLLLYLLENQKKPVSRDELLSEIWGYDNPVETRATDDTVKRLRRKLAEKGSTVSIDTVWGFGFKLRS